MAENGRMRQTLVRLLGNVQDGKEIRSYLHKFAAQDSAHFGVIKLGGAIIENDLSTIASNLALIHSMGLTPIVVHGAGPQFDTALAEAGVETPKVDGLRKTPQEALPILNQIALSCTLKLVGEINANGAVATPAPPSVVRAEFLDADKLAYVGEPLSINREALEEILRSGAIPVLNCLAQTECGQVVNINADSIVRRLALELNPLKIVFVTETAGLLDSEGDVIHSINLSSDYDRLADSRWVTGGMLRKIVEIKQLLDELPPAASVSITGADGLIRELFTHGGAGTLVRRGEKFLEVRNRAELPLNKVSELLSDSFGRTLKTGYWGELVYDCALMSEHCRAVAIMSRLEGHVVLDKFAVSGEARGEGLAHALWRAVEAYAPVVFWRARRENPFNEFYYAHSDGFVRRDAWNIYWTGAPDLDSIAEMTQALAAAPDSFIDE